MAEAEEKPKADPSPKKPKADPSLKKPKSKSKRRPAPKKKPPPPESPAPELMVEGKPLLVPTSRKQMFGVSKRKIISILDSVIVDADPERIPTVDDFSAAWKLLNDKQKRVVKVSLKFNLYTDAAEALDVRALAITATLKSKKAMTAYYYGCVIKLPSDVAKKIFIQSLVTKTQGRTLYMESIDDIVKTDKNHLEELSNQLNLDGDGKRDVLKKIVAYGMQVKQLESAIVDGETGEELSPAIFNVADAKLAITAVQELNRMDHEYGDDTKATSSIESQAERIRRLMAEQVPKDKKTLKKISTKVGAQEFQEQQSIENAINNAVEERQNNEEKDDGE